MKINTVIDYIERYVSSIFYPLTLAVLSFLIWILPGIGSVIFAVVFSLLSFLPLFTKCGKAYTALFLFPIICQSEDISLTSISPHIILIGCCIFVSLVLFLIIHRMEFIRGDMLIPLALLLLSFFISYFYASIINQAFNKSSLLFLSIMTVQLLLYSLLCTILGKGDSFPYLCKSIVLFSITISMEIFTFFFRNGFEIAPKDFSLGWSYTVQSASSLLCLTLPFYGILIYSKKWYWIIGELFILASIFLLSTDSALLSLLFAFIPLILLSFRSYGKYYSYISLIMIFGIGTVLVSLLITNKFFSRRLLDALTSLNLFHEPEGPRKDQFEFALSCFKSNPYVGTSISSFVTDSHTLNFAGNTILSVLAMSGCFGLIFYLFFEIKLYVLSMKKKTPDKWIFLVFLLLFEMIGQVDNTLFNIGILQLLLVSLSTYEMTNRPEDVVVHDEFYRHFRKKPDSLT